MYAIGMLFLMSLMLISPNLKLNSFASTGASSVPVPGDPYVIIVEKNPPPSSIPIPSGGNSLASPLVSGPFQYGVDIVDAYGRVGLAADVNYFDGEGNGAGFSSWIGAGDDKGNFWQTGIAYWPDCYGQVAYTTFAVDNYPGSWNGWANIECPPISPQYSQYQFSSDPVHSGHITFIMAIYNGEWWALIPNHGVIPFPNASTSEGVLHHKYRGSDRWFGNDRRQQWFFL